MSAARGRMRRHDAQAQAPVAVADASSHRAWSTAGLLGAAFVALLLVAALLAAFVAGRWRADDEAAAAERGLLAQLNGDAAALRSLMDERLALLAAVAAPLRARAATADGAARTEIEAAIRGVWADAPALAWIDEVGRVVVGAGDLRAGDAVAGRRWFDAAARGVLVSDEGGVIRIVAPLHDAQRRTRGVLAVSVGCDEIEQRLMTTAAAGSSWGLLGRQGERLCAQAALPQVLATVSPAEPEWVGVPGRGTLLLAGQRLTSPAIVAAQGWRLVRAQDMASALPQARGRGTRALAAGAVASALLLPLVWLLAQRLARPQRELAAALNQARERYDYEPQRIPVQGAREAVAVGQAVRAMLAQIAAQQALVDDSAAGYRELFELHPLPMWVVDEESLRFLEVNAAAVRKYGWRRDEFLAMTVLDLRPPEMREAVAAAAADMRTQEHHAVVWQHQLRSGELIDVEVATRQLRWGGVPARIAAVLDVTAQRRSWQQQQRQRRELSELARQLMTTEESERRELAQVLHDRFAPTLYGAKLSLEALRARAAAGDGADLRAEVARVVAPLVQALDASIADTRGLMSDLRPPLLVEHGLAPALAHEVERQRAGGVELVYTNPRADSAQALPRHDSAIEYALFMIAQQALANALRHAAARRIEVGLEDRGDAIDICVRDDGVGFDHSAEPPPGHLGLVGMRERARWIGARLAIESAPGAGTTVRVQWQAAPR
jgi:PAS domain S-box-containing protein